MSDKTLRLKQILERAPVIPAIIFDDVDLARPLAEALVAGGLPVLEVTLRTPNALKVMAAMADVPGAVIGAGTVRTHTHMQQSADAGATFLVSPGASPGVLAAGQKCDLPLLPGTASATEAMAAAEMGHSYLKFFPAEAMGGVAALSAFQSPLPDLIFCPTGGINAERAKAYLKLKNVVCVGGSWVTPQSALDARDFDAIRALAADAAALKTC